MNTRFNDAIPGDPNMGPPPQSKTRNNRRVIRRDLTPPITKTGIVPQHLDDLDDDHDHDAIIAAPILPAVLSPVPALAPSHSAITVAPLDLPGAEFRSGLDRRKQNRELLMDWLRTALVDGVDFGKVHIASKDKCEYARGGRVKECPNQYHWSKPSLFKPGAEKIPVTYRREEITITLRKDDIRKALLDGHPVPGAHLEREKRLVIK